MNIIENLYNELRKRLVKLSPPNQRQYPLLIFADMGLGNLMHFMSTLKKFDTPETFVVINKYRDVLDYFDLKNLNIVDEVPDIKFNTVIMNFLTQKKENVKHIFKIPNRIGHLFGDAKYKWVFNYPIEFHGKEEEMNLRLYDSFTNIQLNR